MPADVDPTGKVITDLRGDADLIALLGGTDHVSGRDAQVAAPKVIVEMLGMTRALGAANNRSGLRNVRYAIKCVAPVSDTGDIVATAIALAVAKRLHLTGPRHLGSVAIFQSSEDTIGPVLTDPISGEPFVNVGATYLAAAQAV